MKLALAVPDDSLGTALTVLLTRCVEEAGAPAPGEAPPTVELVDGPGRMLAMARRGELDLVVISDAYPELPAGEIVEKLKRADGHLDVAVLAGDPSVEGAVDAYGRGARLYLDAGWPLERIAALVEPLIAERARAVRLLAGTLSNVALLLEMGARVVDDADGVLADVLERVERHRLETAS